MKVLILILSLSFALSVSGQSMSDSLGFTNKAEAKNLKVNGLKEGKWVEYEAYTIDSTTYDTTKEGIFAMGWSGLHIVPADSNPARYKLTIYRAGKPFGIERDYYINGKLSSEHRYYNGKLNGVTRVYYESGKLLRTIPFTNGVRVGLEIDYYESGKIHSKTIDNPDGAFEPTVYYKENGKKIK